MREKSTNEKYEKKIKIEVRFLDIYNTVEAFLILFILLPTSTRPNNFFFIQQALNRGI